MGSADSGRKTRTCFLTSNYSLTDISGVSSVMYWSIMSAVDGLMVPKPPAQISAGISVPDRNSTSGTVFTSRPSRARDLVTMVEGGPTPGRVETGVGSVFRGAGTESNLPDSRTGRCNLRYCLDQNPYSLLAISSNNCLLT